jgi:SAM-dependent methyltransferase
MVRAVFHHFPDKEGALDEICRVLRPGGCLHIRNAAYEYRRGYWVYRYFPETWPIDRRRFWPVDRLFRELEARGMQTDGTVIFRRHHQAKSELLVWARNRDLSQLALLSDEAYEAGMSRLSAEFAEDVPTETAILDLTALRGE